LAVAQWGPRKNIVNTINWFVHEFKDEEVGLILKTNIANDSLVDRYVSEAQLQNTLREHGEYKCKVYLLHGTLTDGQMTWLYKHDKIKVMVSLTHGEGFGLPLFEAAYNGLPIICPVWSGQADFVCAPNKKYKIRPMVAKVDYTMQKVSPEAVWDGVIQEDAMWCVPVEGSYKRQLREVRKNYDRFKAMAKRLEKHIRKNFKEEEIYEDFLKAMWPADAWGVYMSYENSTDFQVEEWLQGLEIEAHE
jgi:glycosyltransferase involved in cell wall biosynthesis